MLTHVLSLSSKRIKTTVPQQSERKPQESRQSRGRTAWEVRGERDGSSSSSRRGRGRGEARVVALFCIDGQSSHGQSHLTSAQRRSECTLYTHGSAAQPPLAVVVHARALQEDATASSTCSTDGSRRIAGAENCLAAWYCESRGGAWNASGNGCPRERRCCGLGIVVMRDLRPDNCVVVEGCAEAAFSRRRETASPPAVPFSASLMEHDEQQQRQESQQQRVIGYWVAEKKRVKFNWDEFCEICASEGFVLKMINIESNLESQGPIHVFFHKLTDVLAHAADGNKHAKTIITRLQDYIQKHPDLIVIDPFENVQNLRNRFRSYEMIQNGLRNEDDIFIPNFIEIKSRNTNEIINTFRENGIKFPCVCKPLIAHGSSDAHKMMVIFNEQGLADLQPPCVAQNFINHNAILYKVFIVKNRFCIAERPSFKNFYPKDCESMDTVFFNSHDISKSGSNSKWSIISEQEQNFTVKPKYEVFEKIVRKIEEMFGLLLVGVDVVIENHTGKYAIIDVNAFPAYDGYPNFFCHLIDSIKNLLKDKRSIESDENSTLKKCLSEDLDSGFESDEKKKQSML